MAVLFTLPWVDPLAHQQLRQRGLRDPVANCMLYSGATRAEWQRFVTGQEGGIEWPQLTCSVAPLVTFAFEDSPNRPEFKVTWTPVLAGELQDWLQASNAHLDELPLHPRQSVSLRLTRLKAQQCVQEILATRPIGRRGIQGHGSKPDPNFFHGHNVIPADTASSLGSYLGFELEMQPNGGDVARTRLCNAIWQAADTFRAANGSREELLHIEEDGSLPRYGIEVPTMPANPQSPRTRLWWRHLWQTVCDRQAHDTEGKCGMHIHCSRTIFNPNGSTPSSVQADCVTFLDWFIACLAYDADYQFPSTGFDPVVDGFGRSRAWTGSYATIQPRTERRQNIASRSSDRYRHINHQNTETIEFRIFGTMGYAHPHCDMYEGMKARDLDWLNVCADLVTASCELTKVLVNLMHRHYNAAAPDRGLRAAPIPLDWPEKAQQAFTHICLKADENLVCPVHMRTESLRSMPILGYNPLSHSRSCRTIDLVSADCANAWRLLMAFINERSPAYDYLHRHMCMVKAPGHTLFCREEACHVVA